MRLYVALCVLFYVASCQHCPFITNKGCACSVSSTVTNITCGNEYLGKELPAYDSSGNVTDVYQIRINNTKIKTLRDYEFVSWTPVLKELFLEHNKIMMLTRRTFVTSYNDSTPTLPALTTLSLNYNMLILLDADTFDSLRSLQVLRLSHNLIDVLQRRLIVNLKSLVTFSIHHNRIVSLPDKFIPASLVYLYIQDNRIRHLTKLNFYGAKSLKYLSFTHSGTKVDIDTFKSRTNLRYIRVESKPRLPCRCPLYWYKYMHLSEPLKCNGYKSIKYYLRKKCKTWWLINKLNGSGTTTSANKILILLIPAVLSFYIYK